MCIRDRADTSEDEVIEPNEHNSVSEQEVSDSDNLEKESTEKGEQYVGRDKKLFDTALPLKITLVKLVKQK